MLCLLFIVSNREDSKSHHSHEDERNLMTTSMTLPSSTKSARQASDDSGLEASDKFSSQPNVAVRETDILDAEPASPNPAISFVDGGKSQMGMSVSGKQQPFGGIGGESKDRDKDRRSLTGPVWVKDESLIVDQKDRTTQSCIITSTPNPPSQLLSSSSSPLSSSSSLLSHSSSNSTSTPKSITVINDKDAALHQSKKEAVLGDSTSTADTTSSTITTTAIPEDISVISPDTTSEDFSVDIDTALEEVMAGLKSLEMQQHDKRMSLPAVKVKQTPKHTPDLVLDLPDDGNGSNLSSETSEADSPTSVISAAETFAQSNQGTLKKAAHCHTHAHPHPHMPAAVSSSLSSSTHHPHQHQLMSSEGSCRLSIQSEPGDLALARSRGDVYEAGGGTTMVSSQGGPFASFSMMGMKKSQSAMPTSKGQTVDTTHLPHPPNTSPLPPSPSTQLQSKSPTGLPLTHPSFTSPSSASTPHPPPPVAQKPKPSMKVKPPVMKKPSPRSETTQVTPPQ